MADSPYRIRCSNLAKIWACPGSLQMEEANPQTEEGASAREGTAAHWCFEQIHNNTPPKVGTVAPNGVLIDEEMLECAAEFVEIISRWHVQALNIEQQLPCPRIHPLCGGSPDAWGYNADTKRLYIADFKYGHRDVEIFENPQLTAYTLAAAEHLDLTGYDEQEWTVHWVIYQPRCFHSETAIKSHSFLLADLRAVANLLHVVASQAVSDNAPCIPNRRCRDCTARHVCKALMHTTAETADFTANKQEEFNLSPAQCGYELQRLMVAQDILRARIEGLSVQALQVITSGGRVDGFEAKKKYGRETWKPDAKKRAVAAANLLGIDIKREPELITPNQARLKGLDVEKMNLSYKPEGGVTLARIDPMKAAKIFGESINE